MRREKKMAEVEPFKVFSEFPTNKHVMEICKAEQGKKTCRYLTTDSCWKCLKMNSLEKVIIDERVKNKEMAAKSDNCMGLLGLIIKKKEKLRGKKASYIRYYSQMDANFEKIEIENENEILKITMCWNNKKKFELAFTIKELDITVDEQVNEQTVSLFQNLWLGDNFIQRIVIFF